MKKNILKMVTFSALSMAIVACGQSNSQPLGLIPAALPNPSVSGYYPYGTGPTCLAGSYTFNGGVCYPGTFATACQLAFGHVVSGNLCEFDQATSNFASWGFSLTIGATVEPTPYYVHAEDYLTYSGSLGGLSALVAGSEVALSSGVPALMLATGPLQLVIPGGWNTGSISSIQIQHCENGLGSTYPCH